MKSPGPEGAAPWDVSTAELEALLEQARPSLGAEAYEKLRAAIRTLGYAKESEHPLKRRIALVVAAVVWAGFTLVPLGVVAGVIR